MAQNENTCSGSAAQIVATLSPQSATPELLDKLISHQMDVVRLNFSFGTHEEYAEIIRNVRSASARAGRHVPIIQDLSGPREESEDGHFMSTEALAVLTEKDRADTNFGLLHDVDYIALSYVGTARDVKELRGYLKGLGSSIPIISKIERKEALENIDAIIEASDAIMIARGDLGQAIPIEDVPAAQEEIIRLCNRAAKPVITATEMLLSMAEKTRPTRAEVADVSTAILQGSDAVMLSEETARGQHPALVVETMERIVKAAEIRSSRTQINAL